MSANADHDLCSMHKPCALCVEERKNDNLKSMPCCARLVGGEHCGLEDGHSGDHIGPPARATTPNDSKG